MSEPIDFALKPGAWRGDSAFLLNRGRHRYAFDSFPGRLIALAFLGSASDPETVAALQTFDAHRGMVEGGKAAFFAVVSEPGSPEWTGLETRFPAARFLWDGETLASAFGASRAWVVLDPMLRVIDVAPLANALVQQDRGQEADKLWRQATAKLAVQIPPDPPGSVLWDGGFESGFPNGGLGWHFVPEIKGVHITLDKSEKHSGNQSLRLMFAGRSNISFSDVCHWAAVEPGEAKTWRDITGMSRSYLWLTEEEAEELAADLRAVMKKHTADRDAAIGPSDKSVAVEGR